MTAVWQLRFHILISVNPPPHVYTYTIHKWSIDGLKEKKTNEKPVHKMLASLAT